MKKIFYNKLFIISIAVVYLCATTIFGYIIFGCDDKNISMNASFLFIIFNFVFNLLFVEKSSDFMFTTTALFFTIIADRILVYGIMDLVDIGITVFTFVQISYFFKNFLSSKGKIRKIIFAIMLPTILIASIIVANAIMDLTYLIVIALTYFSFLLISCVFAFTRFIKNPLFALGLLLFICCDIILGCQVIGVGGSIEDMNCWWFYFPSQALIILSVIYLRFLKVFKTKQIDVEASLN